MAKAFIEFMRKRGTVFGVSSLLLGGLEKLVEGNFKCPCEPGENELKTACYAFIPFFGSFIITFFFVKMKPDETIIKGKCTCERFLFSTIIAFIWLVFFFMDGRYVLCAFAQRGEILPVCRRIDEIDFTKGFQNLVVYVNISKGIGGVILVFVMILYACLQIKLRSRRN